MFGRRSGGSDHVPQLATAATMALSVEADVLAPLCTETVIVQETLMQSAADFGSYAGISAEFTRLTTAYGGASVGFLHSNGTVGSKMGPGASMCAIHSLARSAMLGYLVLCITAVVGIDREPDLRVRIKALAVNVLCAAVEIKEAVYILGGRQQTDPTALIMGSELVMSTGRLGKLDDINDIERAVAHVDKLLVKAWVPTLLGRPETLASGRMVESSAEPSFGLRALVKGSLECDYAIVALKYALDRFNARASPARASRHGYTPVDPLIIIGVDTGPQLISQLKRKAANDARDKKQLEHEQLTQKKLDDFARTIGTNGRASGVSFADKKTLALTPRPSKGNTPASSAPSSAASSRASSPGRASASLEPLLFRKAKETLVDEANKLAAASNIERFHEARALWERLAPLCSPKDGKRACVFVNLNGKCDHAKVGCLKCPKVGSGGRHLVLVELTRKIYDACAPALKSSLKPVLTA